MNSSNWWWMWRRTGVRPGELRRWLALGGTVRRLA
jgi:hypothetical protein